jgi:hypothetical protein
MKTQISETTMVETGVMVMKNGYGWGVVYADGYSTSEWWMPATEAPIHNPEYCKKPTDVTYKGSHYTKELETATLVQVTRKTQIFLNQE